MYSLKKKEEVSSDRFLLCAKSTMLKCGLIILGQTYKVHKLLSSKTPSFKKSNFSLLFCSLVELTQLPIGHQWHISILTQWTKCLQWFIRDLFFPSTNGPPACSLLAVWHPLPDSLLSPGGKRRRRCRGLMELFNSRVMGYCSSYNDSVSLC